MRRIVIWLSYIVIFTVPWEDSVLLPGLGSVARLVGIIAAVAWLGTVLVRGEFRRPQPFHLAVFAYVLWQFASTLWSKDAAISLDRVQTYVQLFVLAMLLWDLYVNVSDLRNALQCYVLGGYVAIISTIINFFSQSGFRGQARYAATGFDPNNMGVMLAMGIPLAWYLSTQISWRRPNPILQILNYAYIPGAVLAILLSASRTSLLCTIPAAAYMLLTFNRMRLGTRLFVLAVLVYALFAIQPLVPQTSFERFAETGDSISSGNLTGRVAIWKQGMDLFTEHPIIGVGSGMYRHSIDLKRPSHNVFIGVSAESGIIGITLLLIVFFGAIYNALRHKSIWNSMLWLVILFIWLLGATTLNWEYAKITWIMFSLVVCSSHAVSAPLAQPAAPRLLLEDSRARSGFSQAS